MNFYWIKTNSLIKRIFSNYIWDIPNMENKIYLTFDDGPTPEITEWVLEVLKEHQIKATFFCIGKNIQKHPAIFNKIIDNGHAIGNHTFNHLNGWRTLTGEYLENIDLCKSGLRLRSAPVRLRSAPVRLRSAPVRLRSVPENLKSEILNLKSPLFRPPYGKIKTTQSKKLRQLGYKIIMWDVLSADFDQSISPEKCLENVLQNTKSGSIIVFHDSVKAFKNLEYALPKAIAKLKQKGFEFDVIR
ncbi:polysaccharide deacetylase family protein [Flavobacterium sp. ZT3R18]|uniref:polysaccharide deacetylase family protein n=1 Tax=Flavobacterium sp. ZT3R18 TaxID=2594429 RepID=UPI00117AF933|nr:polysaccharide deacetylase family protein [Flavobacterium sp. ZT3R18]TRX38605.1 polysaccharide deacetylase family protein [Flavobacterium sp. ZT3R18]